VEIEPEDLGNIPFLTSGTEFYELGRERRPRYLELIIISFT
jgi:hypothetical protein